MTEKSPEGFIEICIRQWGNSGFESTAAQAMAELAALREEIARLREALTFLSNNSMIEIDQDQFSLEMQRVFEKQNLEEDNKKLRAACEAGVALLRHGYSECVDSSTLVEKLESALSETKGTP